MLTNYALHKAKSQMAYTAKVNTLNDSMLNNNFRNPINETFLVCMYNFEACDLVSSLQINFVKHPYFSNCIKIIVNEKVTKPGSLNGLSIEMILDSPSSLNTLTNSNGIRVFVHNKSIEASSTGGLDASTVQKTNIQLKRVFKSQLPAPYSNCISDTSGSDLSHFFRIKAIHNCKYTH